MTLISVHMTERIAKILKNDLGAVKRSRKWESETGKLTAPRSHSVALARRISESCRRTAREIGRCARFEFDDKRPFIENRGVFSGPELFSTTHEHSSAS